MGKGWLLRDLNTAQDNLALDLQYYDPPSLCNFIQPINFVESWRCDIYLLIEIWCKCKLGQDLEQIRV